MCAAVLLAMLGLWTETASAANRALIEPTGDARYPHGVVDDAGTLHLVWMHRASVATDEQVAYCTIASGSTSCTTAPQLLPKTPESTQSRSAPYVYRQGSTLRVVQHETISDRTYAWTATAGGTFGAPVMESEKGAPGSPARPGLPEGDSLVTMSATKVQGFTFGGAVEQAFAQLPGSGAGGYGQASNDVERVPTTGQYIASALDFANDQSYYWVTAGNNGFNSAASWTTGPVAFPGKGSVDMSTGPLGLRAAAAPLQESGPIQVLRWTGSAFASPAALPDSALAVDVRTVQAAGRLWVVASTLHDGGKQTALKVWSSTDGTTWAAPYIAELAPQGEFFASLEIAVGPDGKGFATYGRQALGTAGATVTDLGPARLPQPPPDVIVPPQPPDVVRPMPPPPPPPAQRTTKALGLRGSQLLLQGPNVCAARGKLPTMGLRVVNGKSAALRKLGLVRPTRVTFRLLTATRKSVPGKSRVAVDRVAPFSTKALSTAGLVAGRSYLVRYTVLYRLEGPTKANKRTTRTRSADFKITICR